MKKIICIVLVIAILLVVSACDKKDTVEMQPELTQMKAICELATLECYYHNVAKFKEPVKVMWWEETKHFWVEYEGIVKIGVDTSLITIDISEDDTVSITIPPAEVFGCSVDSKTLNDKSFIVDSDSPKITADDQTEAFAQAEVNMLKAARSDKALLINAQQRAKDLLTNYVTNIGKCVEKQYKVVWVEVDENGNPLTETTDLASETTK